MKALKVLWLVVVVMLVVVVLAGDGPAVRRAGRSATTYSSCAGRGVGAGIGAGIVLLGAGYGFSRIGSAALESMARQPEVAGRIRTAHDRHRRPARRRDVLRTARLPAGARHVALRQRRDRPSAAGARSVRSLGAAGMVRGGSGIASEVVMRRGVWVVGLVLALLAASLRPAAGGGAARRRQGRRRGRRESA